MNFDQRTPAPNGQAMAHSPMTLPPGWQAALTAEGQTYYIDYNTKTTHWTIPYEAMQPQPQPPQAPQMANGFVNNMAAMNGNGSAKVVLPQYVTTPYLPVAGGYNAGGRGMGMYGQNNGAFPGGRPRRGIDRSKMKTKMCMNIQSGGSCSYGANCAFAHSSEELSTHPNYNNNNRNGTAAPNAYPRPQQQAQQQQQAQPQQQQQQAQPITAPQ